MTWLDLINTIPADKLNTDVTVLVNEEYYRVKDNVFFADESEGILDPGHPYIEV
jgi:hypothetical protein